MKVQREKEREFMSQMQKSIISTTSCINKQFWFSLFACFLLWALLLCTLYTAFLTDNNGFFFFANYANSSSSNSPINPETTKKIVANQPPPPAFNPVVDSCSGKYIYVHNDLPIRFNKEILKDCSSLLKWFDMCQSISNMGFGPKAGNSHGILQNKSWFATNQFSLEVIFHSRMKKYKCLTNDSSLASAIYVPFYAGLDIGRHLWGFNTSVRDSTSLDLVNWLSQKPEWKKMWGRDHFLVSGRVAWDFNRQTQSDSDWGNNLLTLPETKNMTVLIIESSPWINNNFAIPYPTYFHPTTENEVFQWQNKVRTSKRKYLFSFVGAPRPSLQGSIRAEIITQCLASKKCTLLDCNSHGNKCDQPFQVIKMFRSSTFCLQPSGDSFTRRSTFDSILAGCIPVFFHPASAYKQYLWYLPKDYTKYSVFIPENEIKDGKVKIEGVLRKVSKEQAVGMREEVVRLIPKVVYQNSITGLETSLGDAFDIAVKGVLDRVEKIRKEMLMKE